MINKVFAGPAMRQARESKGWSQDELASVLSEVTKQKYTQPMVQKWESGKRGMNLENATKISRVLEITLNQLLKKGEQTMIEDAE